MVSPRQEPQPISRTTWLVWATALVWIGFFHPYSLVGLLGAWGLSFVILNILNPSIRLPRHSKAFLWCAFLALSGYGLSNLPEEQIPDEQQLRGKMNVLADRAALEKIPALFPTVLQEGIPQYFYARVPKATTLALRVAGRTFGATHLGEGLFRIPVAGNFPQARNEMIQATLSTDLGTWPHELQFTKALPHPRMVCAQGGEFAYVLSRETDEIFIVGQAGVIETLATADGPSDCALVGDELFVTHLYASELWRFDTRSRQRTAEMSLGAGQWSLALSQDETQLAVTVQGKTPGITIFPLQGPHPSQPQHLPLPVVPEWIQPGPTQESWVVSSRRTPALISVTRENGRLTHRVRKLSRPVIAMAPSVDGESIFAAMTGYHPEGEALLGNHYIRDQIVRFSSSSLELVDRLFTHRRADTPQVEGDFLKWTAGASPSAITPLQNGNLLVSFSGTTEWWEISPTLGGEVRPLLANKAGLRAPHGVGELASGQLVLTSPAEGTVALFDPKLGTTQLYQLGPRDEELESHFGNTLLARQGEKAFFEATRSGRSCQSCHTHGQSDYSRHNIGHTHLMPATLSIEGVRGTAPYLRGGVYDSLAELMHVPEEILGGYFYEDPNRADAIAAFVLSRTIARYEAAPSPNGLQGEQRGLKSFFQARCVLCHALPAFTNLSQHPARRLFPDFPDPTLELDTPSLLGLGGSGPYLFDGRAETLRDVLESEHKGSQHGWPEGLSEQELEDLLIFLESL